MIDILFTAAIYVALIPVWVYILGRWVWNERLAPEGERYRPGYMKNREACIAYGIAWPIPVVIIVAANGWTALKFVRFFGIPAVFNRILDHANKAARD